MTNLPNEKTPLYDPDSIALMRSDGPWLRTTVGALKTKLTDDGFLTDLDGTAAALGVLDFTLTGGALTDGGAAVGTLDLETALPEGARVIGTQLNVTVAFTGDVSATLTVGTAVDPDRFNTGTPSVFTTGHKDMGAPSGTAGISGDTVVRITVTSSSDISLIIDENLGSATGRITYLRPLA